MHYKTLKVFLFTSFLFSSNFLDVQIDNISSTRVLSITQDSSGFIWIGTDEGLNRYDGVQNKIYRSNIFDDKTISGNRVWITYLDKNNTLWVGTDRGVCYYDKEKDKFNRVETGSKPIHVLENKENVYFTTSNNGVFKIIKQNKKVFNYQFDPLDPFSLSSSKFSEVQTKPLSVKDDIIWVGTINGLNQVNIKTGQTKRFYNGKSNFVKADTITSVLALKDDLYIGTTKGIGVYKENLNDKDSQVIQELNKKHIIGLFQIKEIGSVAAILKDEVVIFKNSKIIKRINTANTFKKVTNLQTGQYILTSNEHRVGLFLTVEGKELKYRETRTPIKPTTILVDKEGGLWMVGDEGLLRAANTTNPVKTLKAIPTRIGKFSKAGKDLFILTKNNITKYLENGKTKRVSEPFNVEENKKIYVSEENNVFLYDKKIDRLDKNGKTTSKFSFNTPINNVFSKGNNLFISFKNNGIVHCDLKTNTITDYRKNRLLSKILPRGASSFYQRESRLWLGNDESGLFEIDIEVPETPRLIRHHTYDKNNPNSFSSSSVSCITEHAGRLFIGTSGDGFFIYNKSGFTRFSIQEGLPSNNIISFTGSSDSTIWVLTNAGVSLVDWARKSISNIGSQEGLKPFFKNQNSLFSKEEGVALLVSPSGIQEINADELYINEYEATIVVESVELIDKQNKKHRVDKTGIKANHTTPIIRINLTTPSIYKANQTTFSYFVDNYHTDWVDNGTRRYLELQGLKSGHQKVRIKSYNNDGYESINTAELSFQIVPPWWETWWAYFSYMLIIASGIFYYIKYQTKAQQKAAEDKRKEEELEEARQFQLDMLPKTTPSYLDLDISAAIQTASEVGGDYYDYFTQEDKKSLYVVVGDATGHGMTAGMMVSITKAGLYGIPSIPPNEIASRLNRVIKAIDLGLNRMAFNMARFWEDKVEFTSAAMPPAYHYRAKTKDVDEILLGGLPLGSIKNETFSLEELPFEKGDSLIFISDGLPEATNKENEMLGYEAVFDCVKSNGEKNAEFQKQALLDLGTSWLGDLQNQDDITIVVVKKTISLD